MELTNGGGYRIMQCILCLKKTTGHRFRYSWNTVHQDKRTIFICMTCQNLVADKFELDMDEKQLFKRFDGIIKITEADIGIFNGPFFGTKDQCEMPPHDGEEKRKMALEFSESYDRWFGDIDIGEKITRKEKLDNMIAQYDNNHKKEFNKLKTGISKLDKKHPSPLPEDSSSSNVLYTRDDAVHKPSHFDREKIWADDE